MTIHHMCMNCIYTLNCFSAKDSIDVDLLVKGRTMMLRRVCPEGIDRCHCLNKPGTFTEGPFYFDEDPIQASITHITCTPGTIYPVTCLSNYCF